jgi:hypothetical protein
MYASHVIFVTLTSRLYCAQYHVKATCCLSYYRHVIQPTTFSLSHSTSLCTWCGIQRSIHSIPSDVSSELRYHSRTIRHSSSLALCLHHTLSHTDCNESLYSNFPRISDSRNKKYSPLSIVTFIPPYSGSRTVSPALRLGACRLPATSRSPGPTAMTLPSLGSLVLSDGKKMPEAVCTCFSALCTKTRSPSGASERKSV